MFIYTPSCSVSLLMSVLFFQTVITGAYVRSYRDTFVFYAMGWGVSGGTKRF